jgi:hypothetical protein
MVVVAAVSVLALAGCSSTWVLKSSPQTPAARGKVVVTSGPNDNTRLAVTVQHLAHPGKVLPSGTVYVVWARGVNVADTAQNLGALRVSKDLTGELDAVTPLREMDLSITVESSRTAGSPTSRPVLSAHILRR